MIETQSPPTERNPRDIQRRRAIRLAAARAGIMTYGLALWRITEAAVNAWVARRAASKGAALALYILFSLAPMLVLLVTLASFIFDEEAVRQALLAELGRLIGAQGGEAIRIILSGSRQQDQSLMANILSGGFLLASATSAFAELKGSLDELWKIPPLQGSGLWRFMRERILSFGLVLVLALMLMVSLAINAALAALQSHWHSALDTELWLQYFFSFLSGLIVTLIFALIYKYLPATRIAWKDVLIGSLLTTTLFMFGKMLIGLYLGHGNFNSAYGAAGSVVALITWIYYSAQIFFFGALFTYEYTLTLGSRRAVASAAGPESSPTSH